MGLTQQTESDQDGDRHHLGDVARLIARGGARRAEVKDALRRLEDADPEGFALLLRNMRSICVLDDPAAGAVAEYLLRNEPESAGLLSGPGALDDDELRALDEAIGSDADLAEFVHAVESELPKWRELLDSARSDLIETPPANAAARVNEISGANTRLVPAPGGWHSTGSPEHAPTRQHAPTHRCTEAELNGGLLLGRWRLARGCIQKPINLALSESVALPSLRGFRITLPDVGEPVGVLRMDVDAAPSQRGYLSLEFLLEDWTPAGPLSIALGDAERPATGVRTLRPGQTESLEYPMNQEGLSFAWLHLSWGRGNEARTEVVPLPLRPPAEG